LPGWTAISDFTISRHTAAGLLIAQGAHPKEIQALGAQLDAKIEVVCRQARGSGGENVVHPPS
jgi:hypothetical protein